MIGKFRSMKAISPIDARRLDIIKLIHTISTIRGDEICLILRFRLVEDRIGFCRAKKDEPFISASLFSFSLLPGISYTSLVLRPSLVTLSLPLGALPASVSSLRNNKLSLINSS